MTSFLTTTTPLNGTTTPLNGTNFNPIEFFYKDFIVLNVCFFSTASDLTQLSLVNKDIFSHILDDPHTFSYLFRLRNLPLVMHKNPALNHPQETISITLPERLQIATLLQSLVNSIHFNWGSTELVPKSLQPLRELAKMLLSHIKISCVVVGHCGIEAPVEYARAMTLGRCQEVSAFLELQGVAKTRIEAVGMGFDEAKTLEVGPLGEMNRRVDFFLKVGSVVVPAKPGVNTDVLDKIKQLKVYLIDNNLGAKLQEFGEERRFFMSLPNSLKRMIFERNENYDDFLDDEEEEEEEEVEEEDDEDEDEDEDENENEIKSTTHQTNDNQFFGKTNQDQTF